MLTVAYIGFGVSVREYHIPYVENRNDIKVKYVYRRNEDIEAFKDYEPFYPEITFTTNINDIKDDSEVNLVVISAPDAYHVPYSIEMLEAGKNVLCEKPFAPTSKEAKEVFDLAKQKGLCIMPNQNRRYDADYLAMKQVIDSGKLGKIVRVESHYDYFKKDGWNKLPALYNLGVHTIDQIIGLFGIPQKCVYDVRSIHNRGKADDYYDLGFYYDNMKASVHTSMCVMIDYPSFTVHGTNGSLTLPPVLHGSGQKKVIGRHVVNFEDAPKDRWGSLVYLNENGEKVYEDVKVGCNHYERIYDNLIDVIENGAAKVIKDEEVIKVLQILEEATEVANNNK